MKQSFIRENPNDSSGHMSSTMKLMADDIRSLQAAAGKAGSCLKNSFVCDVSLSSQIYADLLDENSIKMVKLMENETEKPEKQPLKEQAAELVKKLKAEELLRALGYVPVPSGTLRDSTGSSRSYLQKMPRFPSRLYG